MRSCGERSPSEATARTRSGICPTTARRFAYHEDHVIEWSPGGTNALLSSTNLWGEHGDPHRPSDLQRAAAAFRTGGGLNAPCAAPASPSALDAPADTRAGPKFA